MLFLFAALMMLFFSANAELVSNAKVEVVSSYALLVLLLSQYNNLLGDNGIILLVYLHANKKNSHLF